MIRLLTLIFAFTALTAVNVYAGFPIPETDTQDNQLVGYFDLRDRESYIQITNAGATAQTVHVQIFNVANLCNENNFFDAYTPSDTHTYNLRDILTNDGNPSGVVLPSDAYGIIVATHVGDTLMRPTTLIGNLRIEDNNGYEYRTNLNGVWSNEEQNDAPLDDFTFNFNSENGVVLSDVVGIMIDDIRGSGDIQSEASAANVTEIWANFDIDIFDLNEVPFSCRNVVFACTESDGPQVPSILEAVADEDGSASVASLEYGINEAIPSSKDAPLLCPNNVITDGIVRLSDIEHEANEDYAFVLYVGLNNGNGRGSMDSLWYDSCVLSDSPEACGFLP